MINKPPHYNQGKIEVSDFIIDQRMNFLEGNVVKYVARHKLKNGVEDLKKARWYLNKLIDTLDAGQSFEAGKQFHSDIMIAEPGGA